MRTLKVVDRNQATGRARRPTRADLFLAMVTLIPVLLIGYSLGVSLMTPEMDVLLVVSALLIMGVGGFVIWDTALSPVRAVAVATRATSGRHARVTVHR